MTDRVFTPKQELFLEYLFNDPECQGDTRKACIAAGYNPDGHYALVRSLQDEILRRSNLELARHTPKAVRGLVSLMDEDGSTPKADIRMKAVESVLDRAGLAKKQEVSFNITDSKDPILLIPAKVERPDVDALVKKQLEEQQQDDHY